MPIQPPIKSLRDPLNRVFSLPRLPREFYQADAAVFWTLTVFDRKTGWLTPQFHQRFRELMLHAAAREGLLGLIFWPKFWRIHGKLRLPDAGNIKRPPLHKN
jgi:hypothetical protein